jgi:hypothetical protein
MLLPLPLIFFLSLRLPFFFFSFHLLLLPSFFFFCLQLSLIYGVWFSISAHTPTIRLHRSLPLMMITTAAACALHVPPRRTCVARAASISTTRLLVIFPGAPVMALHNWFSFGLWRFADLVAGVFCGVWWTLGWFYLECFGFNQNQFHPCGCGSPSGVLWQRLLCEGQITFNGSQFSWRLCQELIGPCHSIGTSLTF